MIPLGFVSAILPDQSLEEVLDIASKTGFDCVELMCWPVGKAERRYAGVTHLEVEVEDRDYEDSLDSRKAALCQSLKYLRNFCS